MYFKKSLVLSGVANKDNRAVLSMESTADGTVGSVRLYNFKEEPVGILTLGIMEGGRVHKAGLTRKSPFFYTFLTGRFKGLERFSTAVVNTVGAFPSPILYGASEGQYNGEEALASCLAEFARRDKISKDEAEKTLDEAGLDFEDDIKEEISEAIDAELTKKPDCASCKYREVFFNEATCCDKAKEAPKSQVSQMKSEPAVARGDPAQSLPENEEEKKFFDGIRGEIDKIFESNGPEEILTEIIPNSKWAKVEYEPTGEYYAVGLVYDEEEIKYLAYAVPGVFDCAPPKELLGFPVWLPLDERKPEGFGYYISYQDAATGDEVKAKVI